MKKAIKFCLWLLAFTPLIVHNSVFFPFTTAKSLFFRGMLTIVSILFIYLFFKYDDFKNELFTKINKFIRNPIFISVFVFIFLNIVSFIFAVDRYIAFWGDLQRAEGLVGLLFYVIFFMFSLLIFTKNDWLWFFKISLITSLFLLGYEFLQFFQGVDRPGSFVHNPTFLSGYLLFSLFSAFVVFNEYINRTFSIISEKHFFQMIWKYLSMIIIILSILGIFLTETRGTFLGLFLGFIAILLYTVFNQKNKEIFIFRKFNIYKLSIIILCFIFVFSTIFVITKKNEIWQKIPGLSRISVMKISDTTLNTRLIISKVSLSSVDPISAGVKKFLIGWGPDNFYLASGGHFDPKQFDFEIGWFDRAHNKFMDVLVMNGVLGLLSYLAIFFFLFRCIFLQKIDPQVKYSKYTYLFNIGFLFFLVSYIVHLFFIFDQISTSLAFFALLSFSVYLSTVSKETEEEIYINNLVKYFLMLIFIIIIFLSFVFVKNDLIGYIQMMKYNTLIKNSSSGLDLEKLDKVFYPVTTAQFNIRNNFLSVINENKIEGPLSNIAHFEVEEYLKYDPLNIQSLYFLASDYTKRGKEYDNLEYLIKGENYYREILAFSPNRLDLVYGLALNLMYQKNYEASFVYFEEAFDLNGNYFKIKKSENIEIYTFFENYFKNKDRANLIKVENRLKGGNNVID